MDSTCPTCGHKVDPGSITQQILYRLRTSSRPVSPSALRAATGVNTNTMYQTLRRLQERGLIRRATNDGVSGWIMVAAQESDRGKTPSFESQPEQAGSNPTPGRTEALALVGEAVSAMNDQNQRPDPYVLAEQLAHYSDEVTRDDTEWAVWSMCRNGQIVWTESGLVAQ